MLLLLSVQKPVMFIQKPLFSLLSQLIHQLDSYKDWKWVIGIDLDDTVTWMMTEMWSALIKVIPTDK